MKAANKQASAAFVNLGKTIPSAGVNVQFFLPFDSGKHVIVIGQVAKQVQPGMNLLGNETVFIFVGR